jgi:hypothetical protein
MAEKTAFVVKVTAEVVCRRTVDQLVTVKADNAEEALHNAWDQKATHIEPSVPEGFQVSRYSVQIDDDTSGHSISANGEGA